MMEYSKNLLMNFESFYIKRSVTYIFWLELVSNFASYWLQQHKLIFLVNRVNRRIISTMSCAIEHIFVFFNPQSREGRPLQYDLMIVVAS